MHSVFILVCFVFISVVLSLLCTAVARLMLLYTFRPVNTIIKHIIIAIYTCVLCVNVKWIALRVRGREWKCAQAAASKKNPPPTKPAATKYIILKPENVNFLLLL